MSGNEAADERESCVGGLGDLGFFIKFDGVHMAHELNSSKNVGTHVLNFTHEHLSVSCSVSKLTQINCIIEAIVYVEVKHS